MSKFGDGGLGLGWVQKGLGTCLAGTFLQSTGLSTCTVVGDRRAMSRTGTRCAGGRCWPRAKAEEELSHPAAESPALMD